MSTTLYACMYACMNIYLDPYRQKLRFHYNSEHIIGMLDLYWWFNTGQWVPERCWKVLNLAFVASIALIGLIHFYLCLTVSAQLMKSKFARRPSSVRLWYRLSLKLLHGFLSNCTCGFPWAIPPDINMGPYGSKHFKTLLLQIAATCFQTSPEFSSQWSSRNCLCDFWNLKIEILTIFFSFSLTWAPLGAKISKRYSCYKSQPNFFKLVLNFPPNVPHKTMFGNFGIFSFRFLTFFFENVKFTIVAYGKIKKLQLSGKRAIVEQTEWNLGLMDSNWVVCKVPLAF